MADLAGFDIVGEAHIETVIDLINMSPITNPVDGSSIYLLGGPFSTDLNVDLGPQGVVTMRVILNATLQAVIHQPLARLVIAMSGGSAGVAGNSFSHIGGQVTIYVPLTFALPHSVPTTPGIPPLQVPVFLFGASSPDCILDDATRALADSTLGPGGADRLQRGLGTGLAQFFAVAGSTAIPVFGFNVVPGIDSSDPFTLSAPPIVAWIDEVTLGIFGYYRAAASGGNVSAKQTDLAQSQDEYFYGQPGLFSVVLGRRSALLLSADAFHRVLACPGIRTEVVRGLVAKRDHHNWVDTTRSLHGAEIAQQVTSDEFFVYYQDEAAKNPTSDSKTWYDKAMARIQADIGTAIDRRATNDEDKWLDGYWGQQAITAAVPPPCGGGTVEIDRQPVKFALVQGDLAPLLSFLAVRLADSRIAVDYQAQGALEVSTGDLSFVVTGTADVAIEVAYNGTLGVTYNLHPPTVDIGGTGLDGALIAFVRDLMTFMFGDGSWRVLMSYLGLILKTRLEKQLKGAGFPNPKLIGNPLPQDSVATRIVDVRIDPGSVLAIGLICRRYRWNEFHPGLVVDATIDQRSRTTQPPVQLPLVLPATKWGCPPAEFYPNRTSWDTTVSVHARLRDAPLPATVVGWQVELGSFSVNQIGGWHFFDPRPSWSNEPAAIAEGQLSLSGKVNVIDAPLVAIQLPFVLGHLNRRERLLVDVSGDPDSGWRLTFSGADGNFYVRLSVDVSDGEGTQWHGETFVWVQGEQLDLPVPYWQYKADCDAKYQAWHLKWWLSIGSKYASLAHVLPGQPVMSDEARESIVIRALVEAGDPAALRRLAGAAKRFGSSFDQTIGQIAPAFAPEKGAQKSR